jgi:hypothetical protein
MKNSITEFYVLLTVRLCTILKINPTRCIILLSIFISLPYRFWGNHVPIIRKNYCIYTTLVFVTLWVASGLLVGVNFNIKRQGYNF